MIHPDSFAGRLLAWFNVSGRHDLPWQHPRTPYRVWLSEVMLQQTQVRVVIPYFERFVQALPDVRALAAAPTDDVLALWAGLGYYARARNLQAAAQACVERHDGELPRDLDALMALPGIGRSTAGAILSQAWGDRFPILDGNVKRVLARLHGMEGWPGTPAIEKRMWAIAELEMPGERMADYTQAQMDFGATLCTRADPACVLCPMQSQCVALREGRVDDLPTPKPGKPLPERRAWMLWIEDTDGRVLLQRRPPTGIWGSLWSFPEQPDPEAARAWFAEHMGADGTDYDHAEALAPVAHGFTHYRLQIQPLRWRNALPPAAASDNGDLRWMPREALAVIGLPAPVRKLLDL
jgi:A/G-specific adenine glycosylase